MWFTRISIHNPVMATMMMLALVVMGLFSYQRMKVDQFPEINFPVVVVQTDYPNASPESVESDITRKVEESVNAISGIKNLTSRSYEGSSIVIIEFELSIDAAKAAQDVREKVALVKASFRKDVKEPRVTRFDPADTPIFSLAVSNSVDQNSNIQPRSLRELTTLSDQVIKKRLQNVRGVGSVNLVGGVKREVQIQIKPAALEAQNISVETVMNAIRNENLELPAGSLRSITGEQIIQIKGRMTTPEEFGQIIVARRGNQPVYLSQVAEVIDGQEEQDSLALMNGQRTLAIEVLKAQGENTIDVVDGLQEAIKALRPQLPQGVQLDVVRDNSRAIRVGVRNVRHTLLEGALLTIAIVFLFLNSWRSTVITGLTLPIALIGTFFFMNWFGFSINMLTLMALSLCVGLLIDDAIVVRENIVRHVGMGKHHHQAALEGTNEIGLAVLATTLSIVAVFLPVGFMGGIIGRFFHQFGITVVAAVLISMFVSFTLDPMLSSVWLDPTLEPGYRASGWYANSIGRVLAWFDHGVDQLSHFYQFLLRWSLVHRKTTLLLAVASFAGGLLIPIMGWVGSEFVPKADYSESQIAFYTPIGSSLEITEAKARQVTDVLRAMPEVAYVFATINTGTVQGKSYANLYVRLIDRHLRQQSQAQMTAPIRERLAQIAGITVTNVGTLEAVGGQKTLQISIQGSDLDELARLSTQVQERLRAIPGIVDVDSSLKANKPTVNVTVRRDLAADLGIGVAQIGNTLRPFLAGDETSTWRGPDDENYTVRVRLAPDDRNTMGDLTKLMIPSTQTTADGAPRMVALRQVAELTPGLGANQINRRNLNREVELTANTDNLPSGTASSAIKKALDGMNWPSGYRYSMGGSTKDMQEAMGYALSALALAVIFIYMILASQFHSFLQPLAIMSSLPLTLIGVFLALMLFRSTFNLFSIIGFIMLMGLVTKNAILLVDFANQARQHGLAGHGNNTLDGMAQAVPLDDTPLNRHDALLAAAHVRLRPILMTTLAMVFGMLPLALGLAEGSEQRAPMGQAVVGGIITASLLTLVVVPVIYTYLDDLAQWWQQRNARGQRNSSKIAPDSDSSESEK